jgi:hypothetical protein
MARHRGLSLALGLCALIGLAAREGRAETITITVSTNGATDVLTSSTWSTSTNVNLTALNTFLTSSGSAYQFSNLGATSNWSGTAFPDPNGGALSSSGGAFIPSTSTGATGALVITVTEGGFLEPVGFGGTLANSATGTYNNEPTGSLSYFNDFNTTASATGSSSSTGSTVNSPPITIANTSVGTVASGYSLTNNYSISLTTNSSANATLGFTGGATVTVSSVIPEPASLVLMLTGMPLPLVVLGLLRRRRAAA